MQEDKGDCFHCHTLGSTFSDFEFRNNGLDAVPVDPGRYLVTLNESDRGKFKTPSLRNIEVTAPYMHDGRFSTLQEVLNHYNSGFIVNELTDPNLAILSKNRMTQQEMDAIIAFLKTLTDYEFLTNPRFSKP
jgi:cytochrome c peroxidase